MVKGAGTTLLHAAVMALIKPTNPTLKKKKNEWMNLCLAIANTNTILCYRVYNDTL